MAKIANKLTDLVGNTPLMELSGYSGKYGLNQNIIAKLEAFNPAGSVKDRVALSMIEDAEARGALKPGATIIEPTSGNTGVGLAMVATIASPTPVFPLVGSIMVAPGFSAPRASASSIIERATLSFTLPAGLKASSLAIIF